MTNLEPSITAGASVSRTDIIGLALATTVPTLAALVYFVWLTESAATQVVYGGSRVFLVAFPALWYFFVERGRWSRPAWSKRGVLFGAAFGLAVGGAAFAVYELFLSAILDTQALKDKTAQLSIQDPLRYVMFGVYLSIANAAVEEYYWRWFVFGRFRRVLPVAAAVACSATAFAAHHVVVLVVFFGPGLGVSLAAAVGIGGAVWAVLYHRSGSLYASWISHLIVDAAVLGVGYGMLFGSG